MHSVQSLADVAASQGEVTSVDFNNVTEAALSQEGQLILTSDDGHGNYNIKTLYFNRVNESKYKVNVLIYK